MSRIVISVTVTTKNKIWDISFLSSLFLYHRYTLTSLKSQHDCCFVMEFQLSLQWSHHVILTLLSFEDLILKTFWALHYDKSINNVTIKSHDDFQMTKILLWNSHCSLRKVSWGFHFLSLGKASQNSCQNNFTIESRNDSHMIVTKWFHCKITWWIDTKHSHGVYLMKWLNGV